MLNKSILITAIVLGVLSTFHSTYALNSCVPPYSGGCTTESDYSAMVIQSNRSGGYLGNSVSQDGALSSCRSQINTYQAQYQSYLQCLATPVYTPPTYVPSQDSLCKDEFGNNAIAGPSANTCACAGGYLFGKSGQCVSETSYCDGKIGFDSYYDRTSKVCTCNYGYILGKTGQIIDGINKCTLGATYCAREYGADSTYDRVTNNCVTTPKVKPVAVPPITVPVKPVPIQIQENQKPTYFIVQDEDVNILNSFGTLSVSASFRKCPSTDCEIIRYYAEGSALQITGEYTKSKWYRVMGRQDDGSKTTGWIKQSLFSDMRDNPDMESSKKSGTDGIATTSVSTTASTTVTTPATNPWYKKVWKFIWRF